MQQKPNKRFFLYINVITFSLACLYLTVDQIHLTVSGFFKSNYRKTIRMQFEVEHQKMPFTHTLKLGTLASEELK